MTTRLVVFLLGATACGSSSSTIDGAATGDVAGSGCALQADTTATSTLSTNGCALLDRDVSACTAARTAAGLTGGWLKFSCRVTLTMSGSNVVADADGQPDYKSNYFAATDLCHEAYTGGITNPNQISTHSYVIDFPVTPVGIASTMHGGTGIVGLALNGVPIYGDFAAPGDDIFQEASTFDRCGGHPETTGEYHYHGEPYAISDDDDAFIGVMRDGSPIYGRHDPDGSTPADLDTYGGHTGVTVDGASVYHYHLNLQTSTATGTAGQTQWFLTTGMYAHSPGSCTGC